MSRSRRSSRATAGVLVACASLLALAGCLEPGVFHCSESNQCGSRGYCEATTGFCSVADATCKPLERRYQEHAPVALAGQCVQNACPSDPVVEIRAGAAHACLVRQRGGVSCWGAGSSGQLGDGARTARSAPATVFGLEAPALHVALGDRHSCALLGPAAGTATDTVIRCWGANESGQLGNGYTVDAAVPVASAPSLTAGVQLAAGAAFTCALSQDANASPSGTVACWGSNDSGQLGSDDVPPAPGTPLPVTIPDSVQSIAARSRHACAVTVSGQIYCWGDNAQGELGDGTTIDRHQPTLVMGMGLAGAAVAVAAGTTHTCALTDDHRVWCWGANQVGQLGDGTTDARLVAAPVPTLSNVIALAAGAYHTCATKDDGSVACWGANQAGQLGEGTTINIGVPVPTNGIQFGAEIAAGDSFSCARRTDGTVGCWGDNRLGQLGTKAVIRSLIPAPVPGIGDLRNVSAAGDHTCALQRSGADAGGKPTWATLCWGHNQAAELGDGTRLDRASPSPLKIPIDAEDIAGGSSHTCLRGADARVWCWGRGASGQLGTPSAIDSLVPTAVSGVNDASAVAAGGAHTCAVVKGAPWCWGAGTDGQLGDGGDADQTRPVATLGLSDAATLRLGAAHTCALRASHEISCWGANDRGQLGDGTLDPSSTPVGVPNVASVVSLAAGDRHTCVVYTDGKAACWGAGTEGQLGWTEAPVNHLGAGPVAGVSGAVEIVAGASHTCARVTPDLRPETPGSVMCWGDNADGQLGDGTLERRFLAVPTTGLTDAIAITAGRAHTCALRQDHTVVCWGSDDAGQLGEGAPLQFSVPQRTEVSCP